MLPPSWFTQKELEVQPALIPSRLAKQTGVPSCNWPQLQEEPTPQTPPQTSVEGVGVADEAIVEVEEGV